MANQEIPYSIKTTIPAPLDGRTFYSTIQEALEDNPITHVDPSDPNYDPSNPYRTNRFIGQKMMIRNPLNSDSPSEYWFKDGIADADLVIYTHEFNDSYEWELIEPSGGGISLNGDPMRLVKGDGSLTAGFMEVRHALDGVFSNIPALPACDGYVITMSADKLYATIYAAHSCNPSFKVIKVSRNDVSSNFETPLHGWTSFVSSANA